MTMANRKVPAVAVTLMAIESDSCQLTFHQPTKHTLESESSIN